MAYSLTYSYSSTSKSYSVKRGVNITTSDKVVIPATYNDGTNGEHPVTSIHSGAFSQSTSLTSIIIPNSITSIGSGAFYYCTALASVHLPNKITIIDEGTFNYCSSLTSVHIPNSVTSIGTAAFSDCISLTSVTIPDSVTSISSTAFSNCPRLTQLILLPSTPPTLSSGVLSANVQSIYVRQSSKAAYKAATDWTAYASKIISDDMYLSLAQFNQKNKEYIDKKLTSVLSELSGKIYRHTLNISGSSMTYILMFFSPDSTAITTTTLINDNGSWITGATGRNLNTNISCICVGYAPLEALMISDNGNLVQFNYSSMTNITDSVVEL